VSPVLCDCEALVVPTFRHLGQHFLKPSDVADISVSMVPHFVRVWGCRTLKQRDSQKVGDDRGSRVAVVPALMYCTVLQDKEI
jgi:hypothetical protein